MAVRRMIRSYLQRFLRTAPVSIYVSALVRTGALTILPSPLLWFSLSVMVAALLWNGGSVHAAGSGDWAPDFYRITPGREQPFSDTPPADSRRGGTWGDTRRDDRWPQGENRYGGQSDRDPFSNTFSDRFPPLEVEKSRPWGEIPPEWRHEDNGGRRSGWDANRRFAPDDGWGRDPGYGRREALPEPGYRPPADYREPDDPYRHPRDRQWVNPYEERYRRGGGWYGDPYSPYEGSTPWWTPGMDRFNYLDSWDQPGYAPRGRWD